MFHSARIKLTAWYLLIIMFISISFSAVIYRGLITEVERFARSQRYRIERQFREGVILPPDVQIQDKFLPPLSDPDLVEDSKRRLLSILVIVNGGILILSGGLGYMLAGITLKPIKDMLDEQNQFITDASHELRTPLTALKSALEVNLRDKDLTLQHVKTLLSENLEDVNKLQLLSDELLELTQYQKQNGKNDFITLSLQDVIKKAVRNVEPLAQQKHIKITHTIREATFMGNENELISLLVILLDNAIKYSKEKMDMNISASKKNGFVEIAVRDHGIGIEKDDIPHIFDRFYRADSARVKAKSGGYGLGLSIAKKIVDRHNGSIHVTSTPGKGSTFFAHIPAGTTGKRS